MENGTVSLLSVANEPLFCKSRVALRSTTAAPTAAAARTPSPLARHRAKPCNCTSSPNRFAQLELLGCQLNLLSVVILTKLEALAFNRIQYRSKYQNMHREAGEIGQYDAGLNAAQANCKHKLRLAVSKLKCHHSLQRETKLGATTRIGQLSGKRHANIPST
eukprot:6187406-Pleurochrysis_carterae.AAC.2